MDVSYTSSHSLPSPHVLFHLLYVVEVMEIPTADQLEMAILSRLMDPSGEVAEFRGSVGGEEGTRKKKIWVN